MNTIYEFPRQDQRYDEAGIWIAKLDNEWSAADGDALGKWIAADQENQTVLLSMAELWDDMSVLSRLSELFPTSVTQPARTQWFAMATAATTVLIIVLAGVWTLVSLNPGPAPDARQVVIGIPSNTVYETAIGEQSTVHLADGTEVVLNTNSLIEVRYTEKYRLLSLERGEIHVRVADDKSRPLAVIAGDKIVQAVGTAFSLEITSDQRIELIVTEGKVVVGAQDIPHHATSNIAPVVQNASSVTVVAGEQFVLDVLKEEIKEIPPEEIEVKLSWRQGNLVFRGESLEYAVAEIGRYTTVEFVILDDELKQVKIAGLFKAGDVNGLLATLRENFDVSYERTGDGKILLTGM